MRRSCGVDGLACTGTEGTIEFTQQEFVPGARAYKSQIGGSMRPLLKSLFMFACTVLACSATYAASVTGTVKGPDGAAFRGAFVQAVNTKTKVTVSVLSDRNGSYMVPDLPAGVYELRIRAIGFRADPKTGVSLTAQQSANADFALQTGMVH